MDIKRVTVNPKTMTQDEIRDVAIHVTEQLLDKTPYIFHYKTLEQRGQYTTYTWELQDTITEAITQKLEECTK